MAPAAKKFTQQTAAYIFLKKALESGEIDSNDTPRNIYEAYPTKFVGYTLLQVRTGFNKIKAIMGSHVRDGGKFFLCWL